MELNALGASLIKESEGCRLTSYQDDGGIWTIGYGHTGNDIVQGLSITQDQADSWFTADVAETVKVLSNLIKVTITSNQFSALVGLAYNIGTGNFEHSSALVLLNANMLDLVPYHILLWDDIKGKVSRGLLNRRKAEVALFNTP